MLRLAHWDRPGMERRRTAAFEARRLADELQLGCASAGGARRARRVDARRRPGAASASTPSSATYSLTRLIRVAGVLARTLEWGDPIRLPNAIRWLPHPHWRCLYSGNRPVAALHLALRWAASGAAHDGPALALYAAAVEACSPAPRCATRRASPGAARRTRARPRVRTWRPSDWGSSSIGSGACGARVVCLSSTLGREC